MQRKKIIRKNLITSELRAKFNVNVIAIVKNSETIVNPEPTHIFEKNEKIFLVGDYTAIAKFESEML